MSNTEISDFLDAIYRFDTANLNSLTKEFLRSNKFEEFVLYILEPITEELGVSWASPGGIAREHFFTNWLRSLLGNVVISQSSKPSTRLICACPQESHHEIGLLIFSVVMMGRGVGVIYLGPNHPLSQLDYVIKQTNADGVALSLHLEPSKIIHESILQLPRKVSVPVFLGGKGVNKINKHFETNGGFILNKSLNESCDFIAKYFKKY